MKGVVLWHSRGSRGGGGPGGGGFARKGDPLFRPLYIYIYTYYQIYVKNGIYRPHLAKKQFEAIQNGKQPQKQRRARYHTPGTI